MNTKDLIYKSYYVTRILTLWGWN